MFISLYSWILPLINMLGIIVTTNSPPNNASIALFKGGNLPQAHFQTAIDPKIPVHHKENFTNGTTVEDRKVKKIERSLVVKIVGCTLFSALAISGISGNSLVIFAILTDTAVKTSTQLSNLAILNLGLTDLMTTSIVCIPAAVSILFDYYPLGPIFCRIWSVFNLTGIVATMGLLAVISIDRFVAVGWSLHYPQYVTYNRLLAGILYVWISTFMCTLAWALFPCEYDTVAGVCDFTWIQFGPEVPTAMWYGAFCTVVFCLIPSGLILYCNLAIIEMSKDKGMVGKLQDDDGKGGGKQVEAKANARILKAMVIVIVSYFVLTFPVAFIRVVKVLSGPKGIAKYIPDIATFVSTILQFSASIVNPLIYGLFRKDFREAYTRIFKKLTFRN